jgi:hypothetical protein
MLQLPGLPTQTASDMRSVLRHECGHLIAARKLGFGTGEITVEPTRGGAGIDLFPSLPDTTSAIDYLRKRVKVLFAGAAAEALDNKKIDQGAAIKLFKTTASDDWSKIRELERTLVGLTHPGTTQEEFMAQLEKIDASLADQAGTLVNKNVALIQDMSRNFCLPKYEAARVANGGRAPAKFTVTTAEIDEYLKDKTIV